MGFSKAAKSLALLCTFLLCLVASASSVAVEVSIGSVKMEEEAGVPGVMGDVDDTVEEQADKEESADKDRNWEPVIAPLPSRNSALGWMVSVPAMLMYKPSFNLPEDRVWISGVFGFYAENESWGGGLLQRMSFGGDKWRLMGALFHAELNYKYYGIGGGGDDRHIVLDQDMDLFMAEGLRRFAPNFFVGVKGVYAETGVGPRLEDINLPPWVDPDRLRVDLTMASIAPRLQYDSRDAEFYPTSGLFVDATAAFSRESFGGDLDYERYEIEANHYKSLSEKGVLASRVATQYVSSSAPFFLYPAFGQDVDLRGYQMGTYRDQFLVAMQTEYRHRFTRRIGAVAFGGVGSVSRTCSAGRSRCGP